MPDKHKLLGLERAKLAEIILEILPVSKYENFLETIRIHTRQNFKNINTMIATKQ